MQDTIIMACILSFSVGLIPQIIKNYRERECGIAAITCVITTVALWVLVVTFTSMTLWGSAFGALTQAILWTVLLGQYIVYREDRA